MKINFFFFFWKNIEIFLNVYSLLCVSSWAWRFESYLNSFEHPTNVHLYGTKSAKTWGIFSKNFKFYKLIFILISQTEIINLSEKKYINLLKFFSRWCVLSWYFRPLREANCLLHSEKRHLNFFFSEKKSEKLKKI